MLNLALSNLVLSRILGTTEQEQLDCMYLLRGKN